MNPIYHDSNNMVLGPPTGVSKEDCATITATMVLDDQQQPMIQTYWKPSPEELAQLNANGHVILCVFGSAHPMVWIHAV
jgi:hypothetical protein